MKEVAIVINMPDPPGCAGQSSAGCAAMAIWLSPLDDVSGVLLRYSRIRATGECKDRNEGEDASHGWFRIKPRTYGAWLTTDPRTPSR